MLLQKGQKVDLSTESTVANICFKLGWITETSISIDASAFLLTYHNHCEKDEDFIFYGNPISIEGAIQLSSASSLVTHNLHTQSIHIKLGKVPATVAKVALTLTIHDEELKEHYFNNVSDLSLTVINQDTTEEIFKFDFGTGLSKETAIVVGEIYRHSGRWKFNAIGSGFYGGLAALCEKYGLEVTDKEQEIAVSHETVQPIFRSYDLRKKTAMITLEKKKIENIKARVAIVLDISGSMRTLYNNGTVQDVVERILAVASHIDDNASLDVWVYDNYFSRLPSATEAEFSNYVSTHILGNKEIHKFGRNNEPLVMEDLIKKYMIEENSTLPVFVIFINDGGVVKPTKQVIIKAASNPIFWQFVGIGNSDFEVLKNLDSMKGRIVDNANFIHVDDIKLISDEVLYDQLLNEFPSWLVEAKEKNIIR